MSFSSANFTKKLNGLQDTQDSIVSISQWVLFHHRHSQDISSVWSQFILDPKSAPASAKKLSLLYLCNDVVQQARHKRKPEFIKSFSSVLPGVLASIYTGLDANIRPKVDRLIGVWEQRAVFGSSEIKAMRDAIKTSGKAAEPEMAPPPPDNRDKVVPDLRLLNETFRHMNELIDISQNNLNQVGIQAKNYLPNDPSVSDNLPSPKIYISKLNVLEKLCITSSKNVEDIKKDRLTILKNLEVLKKIVEEGLKTDDAKKTIISQKLAKLNQTRNELREMIGAEEPEEESPAFERDNSPLPEPLKPISQAEEEDEEVSPSYDKNDDDDDDILPTYTNDDSEDEEPQPKKHKPSPASSGNSTPSHKKTVAFSNNIEIKEYDRDNQTEVIKIIKSDDDQTEPDDNDNDADYDNDYDPGFTSHHKDALELKHEHDHQAHNTDDVYNSSSSSSSADGNTGDAQIQNASAVLDLLSKLQQN